MKRSTITGTLAALSLAGTLALPALADSSSPSPSAAASPSQPIRERSRCEDGFDAGDAAGVRICRSKAGEWRLVTTDPAKSGAHEYTGTLTTDGKFVDVRLIRPEQDDSASIDGEGKINYDFKTFSGIDSMAFHVADSAREVTFNLSLDGQPMATSQIFLGDKGRHPKADPFKLHTHAHEGRVSPQAAPSPASSPTAG
jgi:hypothetical protein